MIAIMRKLIHNNTYKIILWIFLLMMALGGGSLLIDTKASRDWSIKAYGQVVSNSKFYNILRSSQKLEEEFKQRGINLGKRDVEKEAVQAALTVALTQHMIHDLGLQVPDHLFHKTFQERLSSLPPHFFNANGELNQDMFEKAVAPLTMQDFVQEVYESVQNRVLFSIVKQSLYIPEYELKMKYDAEFARKSYSVMVLPLQKYMSKVKENSPSQAELEKFYHKIKNNSALKTPEKRSGVMWVFSEHNYGAPISDAEVKAYYDKVKHSKYVIEPAKMQIRSLLIVAEAGKEDQARLQIHELKEQADKNPENFATLIKDFSHDKAGAIQGGLSPFFSQQDTKMDKAVVQVAFELGTDGQISAPIKTNRGFELIQRVHRNPAKFKDLKEVEGVVKKELSSDRFKKRFQQDANRVIGQMKYNPEVLKAFVERYKGEKRELPLDVRKNTSESDRLFKLEEQRSQMYFEVDRGVILTCTQIEKSQSRPLADIKEAVLKEYFEEKGKDLLAAKVRSVMADIKSQGFDQAAKKEDVAAQKAEFVYKDSKGEFSPLLKGANVQAKLKNLVALGSVVDVMSENDCLIIKLDSIALVDQALYKEQKEELLKALSYNKQYITREGFVDSLYRHAKLSNKIEIKEEILHLIKES